MTNTEINKIFVVKKKERRRSRKETVQVARHGTKLCRYGCMTYYI